MIRFICIWLMIIGPLITNRVVDSCCYSPLFVVMSVLVVVKGKKIKTTS